MGSAWPGAVVIPSASRPSPESRGRLPVASSSRSASMRVPSCSARVSPSGVRSALVAGEPRKISTPARRSAAVRISPAKAASPGSSPASASISVTWEPNAAKICASSQPACAAQHQEPARQVGREQALRGGPGRDVGQALDGRRDRLAPGRDDQIGIGQRRGPVGGQRHLHRARAGDPAGAAEHRDTRGSQPLRGPGVIEPAGHLVAARDRVLPGHAPACGQQQRVRRQAGQVGGFTADQPGLDERHGLAAPHHLGGDVHARGTTAEHDYVESAHTSPFPLALACLSSQPGRKLAGRVGLIRESLHHFRGIGPIQPG